MGEEKVETVAGAETGIDAEGDLLRSDLGGAFVLMREGTGFSGGEGVPYPSATF